MLGGSELRCPSPSAGAVPPRLLRPEGLLLHRGLQPDGSEARTPPVLKVRDTAGIVAHRSPGRAVARSSCVVALPLRV